MAAPGRKPPLSTARSRLPHSADLNTTHPPVSVIARAPQHTKHVMLQLSCASHMTWRKVLLNSAQSFGVQMYGQPQSAGFAAFNPVRRARWKEKIIASTQSSTSAGNVHDGRALNQQYPLILLLNILNKLDIDAADNALDHEVAVGQQGVEAFTVDECAGVVEEVIHPQRYRTG